MAHRLRLSRLAAIVRQQLGANARINLGFVTALVLVTGLSGYGLERVHAFRTAAGQLSHTQEARGTVRAARLQVVDAELSIRGWEKSRDPADLDAYYDARYGLERSVAELKRLEADDQDQQRDMIAIESLATRALQAFDHEILRRAAATDRRSALPGPEFPLADSLRQRLDVIDAAQSALLPGRWNDLRRMSSFTFAVIAVFALLTVLILLFLIRVMHRELARRRSNEVMLRSERERLRGFLDNAADLVVIATADGRIQYVNRAFCQALGFDGVASVTGLSLSSILHGPSLDGHRERVRRLLAGETLTGVATTFVGPEGRLVEASGNITCLFERGKPVEFHAIFRDMTAINAARASLVEAVESAEMANRSKSEFLANMSHELRTPLNSVVGFSDVLLRNKAGTFVPRDITYLTRIHDNGLHLLGLINNILDLSKVESGKIELQCSDVRVGALVDDTLAQLQSQVQGRPVVLVAEYPLNLQPLRTDDSRLKQVIINLVSNALKFTAEGQVTVRIIGDPATGRPLAMEVVDTGIGIPPDRQSIIFNAFQQADNTTARRYGGTGLGLTITRSLCDLMGYDVTVASEVGLGSTFRVRFGPDVNTPAQRASLPFARSSDVLSPLRR